MILETKLIEVRDSATFIPALAIKVVSDETPEAYLLRRAGYGGYRDEVNHYILFMRLEGGQMEYDPFRWRLSEGRTMHHAHQILIERWAEFKSGDVIDVQFELGETPTKKISERLHTDLG